MLVKPVQKIHAEGYSPGGPPIGSFTLYGEYDPDVDGDPFPSPHIALSWSSTYLLGADEWELERDTGSGFALLATLSIGTLTYDDLPSIGVYAYYRIRAVNAYGATGYSNTVGPLVMT